MQPSRRKTSCWSELPIELLRFIAQHLQNNKNPKNLHNFRSTCKKWHRATSISALLPYNIGSETLFSSSIFLLHRPTSGPPWIFTAVKTTKEKIQLYHPLSDHPLQNIPQNFIFDNFHPRRLTVEYHMSDLSLKKDCSRLLFWHDKVLFFFKNQCVPSMVDDCSLLALFRGGQLGGSPPVKPEYQYGTELPWFDISYGCLNKFDDILSLRGVIYALDRVGKLYRMYTKQFAVLKIIVDKPVFEANSGSMGWRKRLVGSSSTGELFLVSRSDGLLRVYKLCKEKLWSWIKVESFGDDDKVLFVSRVCGFFVSADEFPGCKVSNCIIFSNDTFVPYCKKAAESEFIEEEIQIFQLGEDGDGVYKGITSFRGSPFDVFTPPPWVLQGHTCSSSSHFGSDSDPKEDEKMEPGASSQVGASSQEHVSAPSFEPQYKQQSTEIPSTSAAQRRTTSSLARSNEKHEEDVLEKKDSAAESAPGIPSVLASKICEQKIKFQGLDIRSNLLPTLQTIWTKHGTIVGEDTVRSRDMLACALESLAKMIIILQNTTARTLTDLLAKDLESILYDLQCVSLKVDWLVPCVKNALALHKSKPHIESIMDIDKSIAQADEEEREFLARSAEVKQELQERRACLFAKIPFREPVDLDRCLGEGLL